MEIGLHPTLKRAIQDQLAASGPLGTAHHLQTLKKGESAAKALLTTTGELASIGYDIPLEVVSDVQSSTTSVPKQLLVDMPPYPFHHSRRYRLESRKSKLIRRQDQKQHTFLGRRDTDWNRLAPSWNCVIRATEHPWILDHRVGFVPKLETILDKR